MLKVLLTDEMQSAILSADAEDAALLTRAIIAEFKDMEPVELPAHLSPLMGVFKQQISKLKASYNKKVADTNRRVQRYRERQAATVEVTDIPDISEELKRVKRVTCVSLNNTKTKDNIKDYVLPKEKINKKEKVNSFVLGFGGKDAYNFSIITDSRDIYSDKPIELIAADLCRTNSRFSINTWRKLAKKSPWTFRDEMGTLYSEMCAGEIPENPAAVLTWRVQQAYKREGIDNE